MSISESINNKLLSFQTAHVYQLQECLLLRNRVIDASDTGTGKTYCAIAVCSHPRMSIISPSWSGQEMRQTLGRIHRAGSKTPAIQKIVYVAQTYEEQ